MSRSSKDYKGREKLKNPKKGQHGERKQIKQQLRRV